MPKRKYTRFGEDAISYECVKRKCKWQGKESEKSLRAIDPGYAKLVCPKCGGDTFYGLIAAK